MKHLLFLLGLVGWMGGVSFAQTLKLFDVNDDATSLTEYYNGQAFIFAQDQWSGSYNLGVTGTTSGGSSLPNPGRESSGSGSFFADHSFGSTSWSLSGWAQGSIDAGLGNPGGTPFPTSAHTTILSTGLTFYIDTPSNLTITGSVFESFVGNDPSILGTVSNQGAIGLYAEVVDGQLFNDYLFSWSTNQGSSGGTYTRNFNSGVFRLDLLANAVLSSNVPDAFGTQYSSYDAQLSIGAVPEPGSALFLGTAALLPLLRRRRPRPTEN